MKPVRKAVFPGRWTRHAVSAGDQGNAQGNAADRRQAADPICGRRSGRGGHHADDIHHRPHKRSIEDHFDRAPELEAELAAKGKYDLLEVVRNISPEAESFVYIRQAEPLGLGHAVLCAESIVGDEPFAVILADDLIDAEQSVIGQLMEARKARGGGNVLAVEDVPREDTGKYGIVSSERDRQPDFANVSHRREAGARPGPLHARSGRTLCP